MAKVWRSIWKFLSSNAASLMSFWKWFCKVLGSNGLSPPNIYSLCSWNCIKREKTVSESGISRREVSLLGDVSTSAVLVFCPSTGRRCTVLATMSILLSTSMSDHFRAHSSPKRSPVNRHTSRASLKRSISWYNTPSSLFCSLWASTCMVFFRISEVVFLRTGTVTAYCLEAYFTIWFSTQ